MSTTSDTQRASVLLGTEDLTIEDRPVPEVAPGDVLVRVAAVGVCGSDVHYYRHGRIGDFVVEEPSSSATSSPARSPRSARASTPPASASASPSSPSAPATAARSAWPAATTSARTCASTRHRRSTVPSRST